MQPRSVSIKVVRKHIAEAFDGQPEIFVLLFLVGQRSFTPMVRDQPVLPEDSRLCRLVQLRDHHRRKGKLAFFSFRDNPIAQLPVLCNRKRRRLVRGHGQRIPLLA